MAMARIACSVICEVMSIACSQGRRNQSLAVHTAGTDESLCPLGVLGKLRDC